MPSAAAPVRAPRAVAERWERVATFALGGLSCRGCARHAERLLGSVRGVRAASVGFLGEIAQVRYDVRAVSRRELADVAERAGFPVSSAECAAPPTGDALGPHRLGLVFVLLANLLAVAMVASHHPEVGVAGVLRLGIAAIALAAGAPPIVARAVGAARRGRIGPDSLVALAVACAFALGVAELVVASRGGGATWRDARPMGFETAVALVTLALVAHAAHAGLIDHALADLSRRERRRSDPARRLDASGAAHAVTRDDLDAGDVVRVLEGEALPADLRLTTPARLLVADPAVGERTVDAAPGDVARAGSVLLGPAATGRVVRAPVSALECAIDAEVVRAIARIDARHGGQGTFPGAAAVAAATAALSLASFAVIVHALARGLAGPTAWTHAVAVLAAGSSATFGLALPATRAIAIARARRAGVVVKDASALIALGRADTALAARAVLAERGAVAALRALAERGIAVHALGAGGDALALEDALCTGSPPSEPAHGALAVRELQLAGAHVVLVGDAHASASAAGARADVAVAIAPGVLPAAVPAPIVLAIGGPERLGWLVDLARATRRVGRQCVAIAAAYEVVVVPLAVTGAIAPLQAAALALVVTAATLANAARLLE